MSHSEDIFARAVERVEAGESIDAVLTTVPEAMRAELRDLLLLVTATHHLQRAPVPQRPAPRRAERKAAFLQAAAQIKAETAVPTTMPAAAVSAKTRQSKAVQKPSAVIDWLRDFWSTVQAGFSGPNVRLAPLVMIILAVWLGAFGFNTVASAAEMDNPVLYPVKQWMDYQQLNLSSEAARGEVYQRIVTRIINDATDAATELSAVEQVSGAKATIVGTELLVVEGVADDYLLFGPLRIRMQYQPNPNIDQFVGMTMARMPGEGEQVEVTFQIVPVDRENQVKFEIQGISLQFPKKQLPIAATPTPERTATPTATVTLTATATPCVVSRPAGWVPYAVRSGDSLSFIAQRTGTTVALLQQVNCIVDPNNIRSGNNLFAPAIQQVSTPAATQPPLAVTLTAISTTVMTPSVDVTATVAPTVTLTVEATASPTTTVTAETTVVITATVALTPTGTQTPPVTPTATSVLTETLVATPTATLTAQPSVTGTLTSAATAEVTLAETAVATETVEPAIGTPVAPTVAPSETPVATPAAETATVIPATTQAATTIPAATETTVIEGAGVDLSATPPAAGTQTPIVDITPTPTTPTPTLAGVTGTAMATQEATAVSTVQAPTQAPTATAIPPTAPPPTVAPPAIAPTATSTPVPQNRSPLSGG
ncbi:MAG: LysM peptidoglycan-binding domain-containing protein [Caldilineaceae bacterium]